MTLELAPEQIVSLDVARNLANFGAPVLVAPPGWPDVPSSAMSNWQHSQARPAYVDAWRPGRPLIMVTGHVVDVIDVDVKHGATLMDVADVLPCALAIAQTPSGGFHVFVTPLGIGNRQGALPGVDIRAGTGNDDHGFVFIGPTERNGGTYSWLQPFDFTELDKRLANPDDLSFFTNRLAASTNGSGHIDWENTKEIGVGERDGALWSFAGKLRGYDIPPAVAQTMMTAFHARLDQPAEDVITLDAALAKLKRTYARYEPNEFPGIRESVPLSSLRSREATTENGTSDATSIDGTGRRLVLTPASGITVRRVRWLWDQRLAQGSLALLAGREGLGKSTFAYWLTARITRGELVGESHENGRAVLVCATEDSWEHTIVPRLTAMGADLDKVYRTEVINADDVHVGMHLPRDLLRVEEAAVETGAAMLLLDPLMSRIDASLDTHKDGEVRQALEPIAAMADKLRLVTLGLIHLNKTGATDVLDRVMGSKAFAAVARSVSVVVPDPDDETGRNRLFGTPKNNLGRDDLPSIGFTVQGVQIAADDGMSEVGAIQLGDESSTTIREAMERAHEDPDVRTQQSEAKAWLTEYLRDHGPTDSKTVKEDARRAGFSDSTLQRVRRSMRVVVERLNVSPPRSTWSLAAGQSGFNGVKP